MNYLKLKFTDVSGNLFDDEYFIPPKILGDVKSFVQELYDLELSKVLKTDVKFVTEINLDLDLKYNEINGFDWIFETVFCSKQLPDKHFKILNIEFVERQQTNIEIINFDDLNDNFKNVIKFTDELKETSVAVKRKVGAVICQYSTGKILSGGYNHNIIEKDKKACCEDVNGNTLPTVIHAEENAIFEFLHEFNMDNINDDTVLITTFFPCWWCSKLILQSKINTVYFIDHKKSEKDTEMIEVIKYLELNGVKIIQINLHDEK